MKEDLFYPLASIALCTYNGEKYLREQLDSLINQTYPNIEIVAVDDCSTDGTMQILTEYSDKYSFMQVFANERNLGLSKNFEKAISLCKGDFITISDQDDIWHLDKIEKLLPEMADNLLIYSKSEMIDSLGSFLNKTSMDKGRPYFGSDPRVITLINFTWGHNIMFRRELVKLAFPLPEEMDYDWQLGVAALNYGKVRFVDQTLVSHRRHLDNATNYVSKSNREKLVELHMRMHNIMALRDIQYREFFEKIYLLTESADLLTRIRLFMFFFRYRKILYYASKRGTFSKINVMRKYIF